MKSFQIILSSADGDSITTIIVDPAGQFAYLTTSSALPQDPRKIVKISLSPLAKIADIRHNDTDIAICSTMDSKGNFAYFGTLLDHKVIKVDLSNFTRINTLTLEGTTALQSVVTDDSDRYAYFGDGWNLLYPAHLVEVDLLTFRQQSIITLEPDESIIKSFFTFDGMLYAHVNKNPNTLTQYPSRLIKF